MNEGGLLKEGVKDASIALRSIAGSRSFVSRWTLPPEIKASSSAHQLNLASRRCSLALGPRSASG